MTTPWTADWRPRIRARLSALGFETMRDYLTAREGKTFGQLAKELGSDIAPAQVEMTYLRECCDTGRMTEAAAECLARTIIERFRRGWGVGVRLEYRTASTLAAWVANMLHSVEQSELDESALMAIITALTSVVVPPKGWIPRNGDDELIQQAFRLGRGRLNE